MNRPVLMNAFTPATEADDPDRFAGREDQVATLVDGLHTIGSTPLIYGHRGLGKSSLALQIDRIAMGETTLLNAIGRPGLALIESQQFLTFYVTCTDATVDISDLLQQLINAAESIEYIPGSGDSGRQHLVDRTTRKKLTLKLVELESTRRYAVEKGRLAYQELNTEEKLVQTCEILHEAYGQPTLFIVDELDRMGTTKGLASFIKAVSGAHIKFLLVGIASSVSELIDDHQSIERSLVPVEVPLMSKRELARIVTNVERSLANHGYDHTFTPDAKVRLGRVAAGFPWFVHVLGQRALMTVVDASTTTVEVSDVQDAIDHITDNRFAQQFSDMYQSAVRDSYPRETVLRSFAQWSGQDIPISEIYAVLKSRLGVASPSVYRGHLSSPLYGDVLYTPVFQKRGLVRFHNEMFKAYVRMRPSIYADTDKRVEDAWRAHRES